MTAPQLATVIDAARATLTAWNSFVENLASIEGSKGEIFDLEKPIPNLTPPITIKQLEAKLTGSITLTDSLSKIESLELVPDTTINELTNRATAVRAAVEKLLTHLNAFEKDNPAASLDSSAMTAANEKGQQINLPPVFIELYPAVQALLIVLYQMRAIGGLSEEGGFGLHLSQLDAARSAQRRAYGELNRLRRAVSTSRQQLDALVSQAKTLSKEIDSAKTKASDDVQKTEEGKTKAEALIAAVTAINGTAEKLKGDVSAYQESFNKFQAQLDERSADFVKGKEQQERLLSDVAATQKEIQRLLDRSRQVLGEATVAGLSESFAREMKAAGRQLFRTQLLYFFSIALLLFSAGVVLNGFPWLEERGWVRLVRWEPPVGADAFTHWLFQFGNLTAKLIFVAPALLLLAFAARRYSEVFRLKSQYTHKYTVAASLTGFKVEAPIYAEAITAAAFKELLSNPGEGIQKSREGSKKEGNSVLQNVLEPVIKRTIEKMSQVPKAAE